MKSRLSTRSLVKLVRVSHDAESLVQREQGIKPHLVKRFQVSTDGEFEQKLPDVVGHYRNPPKKELVLWVDEKSPIQTFGRIQTILPLTTADG
jgi:hypothetical protein